MSLINVHSLFLVALYLNLYCVPPSWIKDGQPLSSGGGGDLRLAAVGRAERGWYRCVASNMAGTRETDPILLSVIGKRHVTSLDKETCDIIGKRHVTL